MLDAEDDIFIVFEELFTSADYDFLLPAILLAQAPHRILENILGLHPLFILGLVGGNPYHSRQPILWTLIMRRFSDDLMLRVDLVRALLSSPKIGDAYCLTSARYSEASILWITKLLSQNVFWDPRRNLTFPRSPRRPVLVINEARRRYQAPFRWRVAIKATSPFRREGRKRFISGLQPIITAHEIGQAGGPDLVFNEHYSRQIFRFILSRIPAMLELASKSDTLASLRFRSLAPLIACFPKHTKRARLAMEAYAEKHGYSA